MSGFWAHLFGSSRLKSPEPKPALCPRVVVSSVLSPTATRSTVPERIEAEQRATDKIRAQMRAEAEQHDVDKSELKPSRSPQASAPGLERHVKILKSTDRTVDNTLTGVGGTIQVIVFFAVFIVCIPYAIVLLEGTMYLAAAMYFVGGLLTMIFLLLRHWWTAMGKK